MTRVPRDVGIVGATGSVGGAALWICENFPERFRVRVLAAYKNEHAMEDLVRRFHPEVVVLVEETAAAALSRRIPEGIQVLSGRNALEDMVHRLPGTHWVFASSGTGALEALRNALRQGDDVSLANKESVVVAGPWMLPLVSRDDQLRPVDSEHNAIWQCLRGEDERHVDRIWLTASGGPFRNFSREEMEKVTPDQALRHPTWAMGAKITVDSATLMNKGIEILEAMQLFHLPVQRVHALIHPGSLVHGAVRFRDGCTKMLVSTPDMRVPAGVAMAFPERLPLLETELAPPPAAPMHLSLDAPDGDRFPCFALALEAGRRGGPYPALLVGADEVAVQAFLENRLGFLDMAAVVEETLAKWNGVAPTSMEDAVALVEEARRYATAICDAWGHRVAPAGFARRDARHFLERRLH